GGINGVATVSSLNERPTFVSDLTIDKFYFGKDTVGIIDLLVNNEVDNEFATDIKIYGNNNDVRLTGKVLMPNDGPMGLDLNLNLEPLTVKTLEAFSFGNLQKSKGNIRGSLKISGTT